MPVQTAQEVISLNKGVIMDDTKGIEVSVIGLRPVPESRFGQPRQEK